MFPELPWLIGLFVALVCTAALVNWIRPQHRHRVRRLVLMYTLFAVAVGSAKAFGALDLPSWVATCATASELLQAVLMVSLAATIIFSVVLPSVRAELPMIASDLIVGLASIAAALVVLSRHGLDATNALVSGAVVSAVLAISLQSTLGNILGGVALQLDGSINEGDWIQLDGGRLGRVRAVRWRHTLVETRDCSTIVVPNAQLLNNNITILGKRDGLPMPQRMSVFFNVDFRFPPSQVTRVVTEALNASPLENVAEKPEPIAVCIDLAKDTRENFVAYAVRYSIIDLQHEDPTSSRVRARVFTALRRAGIPLSLNAQSVYAEMSDDQLLAKRSDRDAAGRLAVLRTVHLFKSFTDDELRTLASSMNHAIYCGGETITRQGAVAHWLYVLASGRVEVKTNIDPDGPGGDPGQPISVAEIDAPEVFGETGLMTGEPRTADVIAMGDVECYRLGKEAFQSVLLQRPKIAEELSERLATHRVELLAAREGLDPKAQRKRHDSERERILGAIKGFFGL